MNRLICVGLLKSAVYSKMNDINRRVYSENDVAPTIHTSIGGNTQIKALVYDNETDNDNAE